MLIESEHSMAREDRDGSGTDMESMAFVSFVGGIFCRYKNPEIDVSNSRYRWGFIMRLKMRCRLPSC
jgi:hypothetical protein